ncbi:MAG: HAMP domain-containing sensor histidine kinase [Cyclobacteriaceae bacterium]
MSRQTLRIVVILGLLSVGGILTVQAFWFQRAYTLQEKQFSHNVHLALQNTARRLLDYNGHDSPLPDPVDQLSSSYFIVMVNDRIDANLLEYFLQDELRARNITADFEYGIYDCNEEQMVYGNFVKLGAPDAAEPTGTLPQLDKENYYFGVYFPRRDVFLLSNLELWVVSSIILLTVIGFFVYTVIVLLRQRRLSEIQKDFVNNMTHEFKTPVSSIAIAAETLQRPGFGSSPDRLQKYAGIIESEAVRIRRQVEQVLQVADPEGKGLRVKREMADIHPLLEEVATNFTSAMDDKSGRLVLELEARSHEVMADVHHVRNVISNLVDNAIKYQPGTPDISICTKNEKNRLLVMVNDNGRAIPLKHRKRIFDKFYRIPTGDLHDVKGFGLGLYYVKQVMKAHKGHISLESSTSVGNLFILTFPLS